MLSFKLFFASLMVVTRWHLTKWVCASVLAQCLLNMHTFSPLGCFVPFLMGKAVILGRTTP